MEKLVVSSYRPKPRRSGFGLRLLVAAAMAALLAAVAWARFGTQLPDPFASAPGPSEHLPVKGLIELGLLPPSENDAALQGMGLPPGDRALLADALARFRLRLVRLSLVDASQPDGSGVGPARLVHLEAAGYSVTVQLSRTPIAVALPVGPLGQVTFRAVGQTVRIGVLGLFGPLTLPDLAAGEALTAGIVAQ